MTVTLTATNKPVKETGRTASETGGTVPEISPALGLEIFPKIRPRLAGPTMTTATRGSIAVLRPRLSTRLDLDLGLDRSVGQP